MKLSIFIFRVFLGGCLLYSCQSDTTNNGNTGELLHGFSKIADTIYFHEEPLDAIDASTFTILDENFCKDSSNVFYFDTYRDASTYFLTKKHDIIKLENTDAGSFEAIGYGYAKDQNTAWHQAKSFKVADIQSLKALSPHFISDKIHAYNDSKVIAGSHGNSFELIGSRYAKDSAHHYFLQPDGDGYEVKLIPCKYESFKLLEYPYGTDGVRVFYRSEILKNAKPESFVVFGSEFAKDANAVFFKSKQVKGADANSFRLLKENDLSKSETVYAADKNGIYINEKYFAAIDPASFKVLNEKYTLDKTSVFFGMNKMDKADAATFKVFPHYMGDADAEDKNYRYADGKIVERINK